MTSIDSSNHRIMFEKLREAAELQEEAVMHMAQQIAPAFGGGDSDYTSCWSSMDQPSNVRAKSVSCFGIFFITLFTGMNLFKIRASIK